jgi:hypothetical protein
MLSFPRSNYIGRSLQKKNVKKEVYTVPLHERYTYLIDKYLLNTRNPFGTIINKKYSSNLLNLSSQNTLAEPTEIKGLLNRPKKLYKRIKSIPKHSKERLEKVSCTPTLSSATYINKEQNYRAKSVQIRSKENQINSKIRIDPNMITENDSQDEESPQKFKPIYV